MLPSTAPAPLVSIPARRLDVASAIDADIEVKLDWEDYELLAGERLLVEELDEAAVAPDRVASVHLPPGVRTRGRKIGMAATDANVGAIVDFVHAQLSDLANPFLVMHPPRSFAYGDQLSLLSRLCSLTGHEITIENLPDASYWFTPEDIAFFGFVGATFNEWTDLYVTIDSKHLPSGRPPGDAIDWEAVDTIFERFEGDAGMDTAALRKAFGGHLTRAVAGHRLDAELADDGWSPLVTALVLCGERVKSVHFNDPGVDGVPDLDGHGSPPNLDVVRELVLEHDIHLVLEPDREAFEQMDELVRRFESIRAWLGG